MDYKRFDLSGDFIRQRDFNRVAEQIYNSF